jgi:hypothetical protein
MAARQWPTMSGAWVSIGRDQVGDAHQEDARVPQEPARASIACAVSRSGFSRKLFSGTAAPFSGTVQFQIAIPRLGTVGRDAERHERACSSRFCALRARRRERIGVGDHMIRRRHQHQRVGRVLQHQGRGQDGRRRVTADRLDHHARIRQPGSAACSVARNRNASPVITRGAPKPSAANRPASSDTGSRGPEGARTAWDMPCATRATDGCRSRRTG